MTSLISSHIKNMGIRIIKTLILFLISVIFYYNISKILILLCFALDWLRVFMYPFMITLIVVIAENYYI